MTSLRSRGLLAFLLSCLLLGGGGASCVVVGLSLDELPADPIAVTWWKPEDARRRAELLLEEPAPAAQRQGVAQVSAIGRLLGTREEQGGLARFPGRLSFVDPRTATVTPVVSIPRGAIPLAWSDDHERLLFLSNHRGRIQVYEYVRSSEEVRTVTAGRNAHTYAAYGFGGQIAYLEILTAEDGRRFERVWVTDTRGKSARIVFEDRNAQTLDLSPDGKTLLYVRSLAGPPGREPRAELVALDLDTGEEVRRGPGREPSFSPIGDWIVYSAPSRDGWRLRRMRSDGSARSPIAAGIRDEKMPSISPDGQFVVYVGEARGLEGLSIERLFIRRMDASGDRALSDVGAFYSPVW